jgi:methionine sulfoxide reductase heme-binding subunit
VSSTKQIPYWLFGVTTFAGLATILGPLALFGISEQGWQLAARYTVRVSFPLFLLTYLARPLTTFWRTETTRWLLRNRRYLGLSFALAHTIHLGALTSYFVFIEQVPGMEAVLGGGLAYALMFIMAATSNDQSVKALGSNWGRLHTVGLHYLWLIFLVTYLGRLSEGEGGTETGSLFMVGIVGSGLAFAALLLRLTAAWKKRQRRATA